jgi:hypothetical protein
MSVIISNLPSYTGTAEDLRWFVMNNSGETETFKYSGYTSPLKQVGTSILPLSSPRLVNNIVLIGNNSIVDNDFRFDSISIGNNNNIAGPRVVSIGNNQTQLVDDCTYIGYGAGGSGNGGVTAVGAGAIGRGNYGISIGNNCILGNLAGCDRTLGIGTETSINGAYSSNVGAANTLNCERGIILGTSNSLTSPYSAIIGSNNNISSTGYNNNIFGGGGNIISGTTSGSTLVGCSGRTTLYDNTTHVENSHNFKTESFGVTNVGSVGGSIDVDCSLGTLFYFTITANTTPNFINWKEGQRIQFYVDNSGSFTVPTATITGGGSVYAKSGSLNPTNNEITAYYGTIVNGNMFLDEHLNFQPV